MMKKRPPNQQEQALKQKVCEQAEADRGRLLLRQPFIGSLIMRMDIIAVCDYRLPTAATDGSNIYLDCNFYSQLDGEERIFLLAHEVWHCVFLHFVRRQNRDMQRWNIAADLEIQFAMDREIMKNPCPLPYRPSWTELNAEEIYDRILPKDKAGDFGDVHLEKGSVGDEVPGLAKGKKEKDKGEKRKGHGGDSSDEEKGEKGSADLVMDPDYSPYFVPDIVERTRARVVSAARQVERMRGTLPGNLQKLLTEMLEPKLRWQELLAQFVTTCYAGKRRWLPPSRRHVSQGLYLPSLRTERLRAVIAIDTSGSTYEELPQFFSELSALLTSFGDYDLTVLQCDTIIQQIEHFSGQNPLPANHKWKAKGFGGTDFRPVFDYLQKHPEIEHDLLIFFTDGAGSCPKSPPQYPVLWILCQDGELPVNWGSVIKL